MLDRIIDITKKTPNVVAVEVHVRCRLFPFRFGVGAIGTEDILSGPRLRLLQLMRFYSPGLECNPGVLTIWSDSVTDLMPFWGYCNIHPSTSRTQDVWYHERPFLQPVSASQSPV